MKEHPDILDGDDEADEADMEIEIVIKCGLEYGKYAEDHSLLTREIFESHFDEILEIVRYWASSIGYLVFGAFILNTGYRLPENVKELILDAIEDDPYVGRSEEYHEARQDVLKDFRQKILDHRRGQITKVF